jgi:hypothetical protein
MNILAHKAIAFPSHKEPSGPRAGFRPGGKQIFSARLMLSDVQAYFPNPARPDLLKVENTHEAKVALTSCFHAISSWRSIFDSSAPNTPERLEAQLSLADLYTYRGMLCRHEYGTLLQSGKNAIFWTVRAGEAFRHGLVYMEEIANCDLPGLDKLALKHMIKDLHQDIHYSYYYAAVLSAKKNPLCFPLPSIDDLGARNDSAGAHALVSIIHRHKTRTLAQEISDYMLD